MNVSFVGILAMSDDATAWTRDLTLGTTNAIYIEDRTFDYDYQGDSAIQGHQGARYVFRHNKVYGCGVDAHGTCSDLSHGVFSFEIYDNTMDGRGISRAMWLRGGTGVIYNNTMTNYSQGIVVTNYRSCHGDGHSMCNKWFRCTGDAPDFGHPCLDQIGRTKNQALAPFSNGMII